MSASTNFNFPSHPTSRSHALQIIEGTRALEQSPYSTSSASSNMNSSKSKSSNFRNNYTTTCSHALQIVEGTRALQQQSPYSSSSASSKKNYAESTTSTSSFSSRTGLLKEKFRSYGSSSDYNKSSKSDRKDTKRNNKTKTAQDSLLLLGSQIRMGH
ncbi:hypothetical protein B0T20DRAFT_479420 [Sordaria brevicollis]|uniref:Uncharacterized protein n=1 Tax=Sordaria brevicollis TaxID=83679 RepID=A0AAE0PF22_SORBR|nr:hypothetical protein B0T20DRAFT_479420 [Sordaria brevicollis]